MHKNRSFKKLSWGFLFLKLLSWVLVADLGEGPVGPAPPPLTLGKKKKVNRRRKKSRQGKRQKPSPSPPPLSSRLGSATRCFATQATLFLILFETAKKKKIKKIKKKITVCFPQLSVLSIRPLHWQRINKLQSIINYHRRDLFSF